MKAEKFKRIVWFRHDLRIYDNPALFRAAEAQEGVLAVYFICHEMIKNHVVAPVQIDFIRRHLLQIKLQKLFRICKSWPNNIRWKSYS